MRQNHRGVPRAQLSLSRYFTKPSRSTQNGRNACGPRSETDKTDAIRESSLSSLYSVSSSGSEAPTETRRFSTDSGSVPLVNSRNEYYDDLDPQDTADIRSQTIRHLTTSSADHHHHSQQVYGYASSVSSAHLNPSSASATGTAKHMGIPSMDVMDSVVLRMLQKPTEDGGFDGCLRYTDLPAVAAALHCSWSLDEQDDLWYDIQDGQSSTCAVDLRRAADCITQKIKCPSQAIERPGGDFDYEYAAVGTCETACAQESRGLDSPSALTPLELSDNEKAESSGGACGIPRNPSTRDRRRRREVLRRISGPTISSKGRNLKQSSASPSRATQISDKFPTFPIGTEREMEVFNRLTKDVATRRSRERSASAVAEQNAVRDCTFAPQRRTSSVAQMTSAPRTRRESRDPISPHVGKGKKSPSREEARDHAGTRSIPHRRSTDVKYNKPTVSSSAKLFPSVELSEKERVEAWTSPSSGGYMFRGDSVNPSHSAPTGSNRGHAELRSEPTAPVLRRASPGPPAEVPPGYVEAVAKLRNYVASRKSNDYLSTLRPSHQRYFSSQALCGSSEGELRRCSSHRASSPCGTNIREGNAETHRCSRGMTAELENLLEAAASRTGSSEHVAALWRDFEHYSKPILRLPVERLPSRHPSNHKTTELHDPAARPPHDSKRCEGIRVTPSSAAGANTAKQNPKSVVRSCKTHEKRPVDHVVDVRLARPQDLELLTRLSMSYDDPRRVVLDRLLKASLSSSRP